jgi:hypothetical protein
MGKEFQENNCRGTIKVRGVSPSLRGANFRFIPTFEKQSISDFNVKSKLKGTRIFLGIAISLWLVLFPAYLHFYHLVEADFLSPTPNWENPDQEGLIVSLEKKGKILGFTLSPVVLFPETFPFNELLNFSFQGNSYDARGLILRC